ncbi:MAG: hypothetical protein M9918_24625 [Anaerolineae bacterium]|nr:hypothetical protein [Anaerolineae bacterium]
MSNVLKVKTTRPGKYFGTEYKTAGVDVTDQFDPLRMDHMQILLTKGVELVKEEAPAKPTRTRGKATK